MRAALFGMDIVGVTHDEFAVTVVVLNGDFDRAVALFLFEIDGLAEENLFIFVHVFHEVQNAALVAELVELGFFFPLVADGNGQSFIQIRQLAQAHFQIFVIENERFENFPVGIERDLCPRNVRLTDDRKRFLRYAAIKNLLINISVLIDFHFQPFGERVDD